LSPQCLLAEKNEIAADSCIPDSRCATRIVFFKRNAGVSKGTRLLQNVERGASASLVSLSSPDSPSCRLLPSMEPSHQVIVVFAWWRGSLDLFLVGRVQKQRSEHRPWCAWCDTVKPPGPPASCTAGKVGGAVVLSSCVKDRDREPLDKKFRRQVRPRQLLACSVSVSVPSAVCGLWAGLAARGVLIWFARSICDSEKLRGREFRSGKQAWETEDVDRWRGGGTQLRSSTSTPRPGLLFRLHSYRNGTARRRNNRHELSSCRLRTRVILC